jgi:hypothetical protein
MAADGSKIWVLIYQTTRRDTSKEVHLHIYQCENFKIHTVSILLYVFFWVVSRRLNFICLHLGTLCLFHLYRQVGVVILRLPTYEDGTECSETSAYKIQTSGNCPEENIKRTEHGGSFKSSFYTSINNPKSEVQSVMCHFAAC